MNPISLRATQESGSSQWSLNAAYADEATLKRIEQTFRDHLLMAISESRMLAAPMDASLREKVIDNVSKQFHPDGFASDLFTECFFSLKADLASEIDERAMEIRAAE